MIDQYCPKEFNRKVWEIGIIEQSEKLQNLEDVYFMMELKYLKIFL